MRGATVRWGWWSIAAGAALGALSACSSGGERGHGGGSSTSSSSSSGAGASGCTIDGQAVPAGAADPQDACRLCQPALSATAWTAAPSGAACGAGQICSGGGCTAGCFVDGAFHAPGEKDPQNPCVACDPSADTHALTPVADGAGCGSKKFCAAGECHPSCVIAGAVVPENAPDPADPCQRCRPAVSTSAYSPAAEGASCGAGQICASGGCTAACYIGGAVVAPDTVDPAGPCRACEPTASTSAYSPITNGTPCGAGQVCGSGSCAAGCFIGGVVRAAGAANPMDKCQLCQPGSSTTAWTSASDGTACGNGLVCAGGACQGECFIGGQVYPSGAADPADPCRACSPGASTTDWTLAPDGTDCGGGKVCSGGSCQSVCVINNQIVAAGTPSFAGSCASCQPQISTAGYSASPEGAACDVGHLCHSGMCVQGCYINGQYWASGWQKPGDKCSYCSPYNSLTSFSPVPDGVKCDPGAICQSQVCAPGCSFSGVLYQPGQLYAGNPCYSCQPSVSLTSPSPASGAPCGTAMVCHNGACDQGCFINGTYSSQFTLNPTNPCLQCVPTASVTAWTPKSDGADCGTGVCISSACVPGCSIGGAFYPPGALKPGATNCTGCYPPASTTTWSTIPDGAHCGGGTNICASNQCQAGCLINGSFVPTGQNPAGPDFSSGSAYCQQCDPPTSTTMWTPSHPGAACYNVHTGASYCTGTRCCAPSGALVADLWPQECCSGSSYPTGVGYYCN
jgi:hypothetical protein